MVRDPAGTTVFINGHVAKDALGNQVALGFEFFDGIFGPDFQLDIQG